MRAGVCHAEPAVLAILVSCSKRRARKFKLFDHQAQAGQIGHFGRLTNNNGLSFLILHTERPMRFFQQKKLLGLFTFPALLYERDQRNNMIFAQFIL